MAAAVWLAAQQPASMHARVELLAEQATMKPGSHVQLGVHFVLESGWHIYWINPGDSGQPPDLKWQLPPGFNVGQIQWPRPERMQPIPQLADFGYHDEVLLPVTLNVPASAKEGESVQIAADAKWLVCREVCIPEHSSLHLSLPVAATAKEDQQSAPIFARTSKLLPQPIPHGWKVSAKSGKDGFVLSVLADKRIAKAEFFPLEPGQIDNPAPQKLEPLPTGLRITLKKSDLLVKPIPVLRGVLVLPNGPAYTIEAPVRQWIQ
ncbi:MAG TPA: protein-disulfide reductase DsbD domain-containing protein [Candidatus Angelobacter sp.]|nr:protein-disulfide reductase DsbD domain-containing protein [Candidatus Angelobacter sp.]